MKRAIGYYAQYHEALLAGGDAGADAAGELIREFMAELKELIETRHIKTDRGTISIIRELNEKWNAIVSIFEKRGETPPIVRNGFRIYMESVIPELKEGEAS
jgi:hypothetical protein